MAYTVTYIREYTLKFTMADDILSENLICARLMYANSRSTSYFDPKCFREAGHKIGFANPLESQKK